MNISFTEIALVVLVALFLIGPQRLPQVAKKIGSLLGDLRSLWSQVRREAQDVVNTAEDEVSNESEQKKRPKNTN